MTGLYPEIEPYDHGMLDVGDGNLVYWEVCGNPNGKPAVVLHGGPGSGCSTGVRRYFDPHAYRIVLFDQRGCGRSTPHASDLRTDLSVNTTARLLTDLEQLRQSLGIDQWLLFGGSWARPLGSFTQNDTRNASPQWSSAASPPPGEQRSTGSIGVWHPCSRHSGHASAQVSPRRNAMAISSRHTTACCRIRSGLSHAGGTGLVRVGVSLGVGGSRGHTGLRRLQPAFQLAFARIVTHYFHHNAWLEEGMLLRHASALAHIPGILVHGRLDLGSPLVTAWELAQAWPHSELVIVSGAGHSSTDPGMSEALIAATDRFATRC